MKRVLIISLCVLHSISGMTQNVGIGISNPQVRLHISGTSDELIRLQGVNPYLQLYTGSGAKGYIQAFGDDLFVGTNFGNPNGQIRFYNNNVVNMTILPNGNVGIGTTTPTSPLSYPNVLGNKISFWNAGPNNDFGIGIATGVMRLYTAGMDKIAFGWGNANSFIETATLTTGNGYLGLGTPSPTSPLSFPNVLGNKISLWNSGPGNDFGLGIASGAMRLYTAGQDRISFGWGNANNFSETMTFFTGSGQLGIGTTNMGSYKLSVNGSVHCKEVVVETAWADYVFEENYDLISLEALEKFILARKHLPNIPSAREIEKNGLQLGDTQRRMMEKIEELTLYIIGLKKEVDLLKAKIN